MTDRGTDRAVVEAYFAAINSDRFTDLEPLWHPDGELHAVGAPPRIGRAAVVAHFPAVLAGAAGGRRGRRQVTVPGSGTTKR